MEKPKVIGYANLNCFNSASDITEDHMRSFFEGQNSDGIGVIVDVVIDRYKDEMHYAQRNGWNKIVEACKENKVSMIIIPTMSMLSVNPIEVVEIVRDIKDEYSVDFYFMLEGIGTETDVSASGLKIQAMLCEAKERQRKNEKMMRDRFNEAIGTDDKPSAVPVYIDDEQYAKLEKVSHAYGLSTREMISALLTFAIVPQSRAALEEHVFGIDPPKPIRGGYRKHK